LRKEANITNLVMYKQTISLYRSSKSILPPPSNTLVAVEVLHSAFLKTG